jgi:hypothetical protein
MNSLLRNRITIKLSSIISINTKSFSSLLLDYRDVFVIDSSFRFDQWIQTNNINTKSSTSSFTSQLKHPNMNHILADYSNFIHNNSDYNYYYNNSMTQP